MNNCGQGNYCIEASTFYDPSALQVIDDFFQNYDALRKEVSDWRLLTKDLEVEPIKRFIEKRVIVNKEASH